MKKLILLFSLSIVLSPLAYFQEAKLLCYNKFSKTTFDLILEHDPSCLADFAWGQGDVCFSGSGEALADIINGPNFNNSSRTGFDIYDAELLTDGSVRYMASDMRSFFGARERFVERCPDSF